MPKQVTTITDGAEHPPAGFAWHTDLSWVAEPPTWGLLSAVEIPRPVATRCGRSATELSASIRSAERLEGACVVHHPTADCWRRFAAIAATPWPNSWLPRTRHPSRSFVVTP